MSETNSRGHRDLAIGDEQVATGAKCASSTRAQHRRVAVAAAELEHVAAEIEHRRRGHRHAFAPRARRWRRRAVFPASAGSAISRAMSTANLSGKSADTPPLVALIAGPTASGKSDLAVARWRWRERGRPAVVINADSAQVYADLARAQRPAYATTRCAACRIACSARGTARSACSAADWAAAARARDRRGACGGRGADPGRRHRALHPHAARRHRAGAADRPGGARGGARAAASPRPTPRCSAKIPARAAALAPADTTRIARALEVVRSTGRPLAALAEPSATGGIGDAVALHPVVLLPRARARSTRAATQRFARMLEQRRDRRSRGAARPRARSRPAGHARDRRARDRRLAARASGRARRRSRAAQQATRQYAKRQFTWLRHQPPAGWPRIEPKRFDATAVFRNFITQLAVDMTFSVA